MTFQKAREWLRKEAKGRAYSIGYSELNHGHPNKLITRQCHMFILPEHQNGQGISTSFHPSWEDAKSEMVRKLRPAKITVDQAPQGETA